MKTKRLEFEGSLDHPLAAVLDTPDSASPKAYCLFAHCFTCSKNFKAVVHIARALVEHQIAVLRFDFTGLGESGGDFSDTTFSTNVEDLIHAAEFLADQYQPPKILIGHSLGGLAVLKGASRIPSSQAVITLAAPGSLEHLGGILEPHRETIENEGEATVSIAGRSFRFRKQFLEDLRQGGLEQSIAQLNRAYLIFHSPSDTTVPIDHAAKLFQAARHPKSFISLDGMDHLLSHEEDARYVGQLIAQWVQRYL